MQAKDAAFFRTNRGGDITYHGPGQIVGYPILNLEPIVSGAREYIEKMEEAIILTLAHYGVKSERLEGATGVWLDTEKPGHTRKICAIGVKSSRWVTMHGLAFNVNTDLSYFGNIVPCGINDKAVTSLQQELGREIDMTEVSEKLKKHLGNLFEMEWE